MTDLREIDISRFEKFQDHILLSVHAMAQQKLMVNENHCLHYTGAEVYGDSVVISIGWLQGDYAGDCVGEIDTDGMEDEQVILALLQSAEEADYDIYKFMENFPKYFPVNTQGKTEDSFIKRFGNPWLADKLEERLNMPYEEHGGTECGNKNCDNDNGFNYELTGFVIHDGNGMFVEKKCLKCGTVTEDGDGDFHQFYRITTEGVFSIEELEAEEGEK